MAANKELLNRTLQYIEDHPDEWEQGTWWCGTGGCFAGHAAITLSGGRPIPGDGGWLYADAEDKVDESWNYYDGEDITAVESRAKRLLGLDSEEAEILFDATNTIEDLRYYVAKINEDDYLSYESIGK